LAQVK